MGARPLFAQQLSHPHRTQQVHLDGRVEWRLEADGRRRVHHNVGRREQTPVLRVETEPIDRDIAAHNIHPALDLGVEAIAELGTHPLEAVVAKDLAPGPLGRRGAPPGAHEQHQFAVGDRSEEPLDERRSEEARGTRYRHALAGKRLSYHASLLARRGLSGPPRR